MKKNIFKIALLAMASVMVSCQTDALEENISLDEAEILGVEQTVNSNLSAVQCGNSAASRSLGERLTSIQGDRCSVGNNVSGNPGLLDCRAQYRGAHSQEGSWFIYNIVQGNKKEANPTAVRIERTFRPFDRPEGNEASRVAFTGTVRVDRLPNERDVESHSSDYTYICQMHGSSTIRDYDGPANEERHTSAIWLLRAQRTSSNGFRFVLEYGTKPISESSPVTRDTRATLTFGDDRAFGVEYDIEVHYGYENGQYNGYITIDGSRFDVPEYNFTTDRQFFRYGAYRAGRSIGATNEGRFFNQAIIAWKNDVTFCNP